MPASAAGRMPDGVLGCAGAPSSRGNQRRAASVSPRESQTWPSRRAATGPALGVVRRLVGALGLIRRFVEAAGEPVRKGLRARQVTLAGRLPAPRDGDGLVATAAHGKRLGHRDRRTPPARPPARQRLPRSARPEPARRGGRPGRTRSAPAARGARRPRRPRAASPARPAPARRRRERHRPGPGGRAPRRGSWPGPSVSVVSARSLGAVRPPRTRSASSGRPVAIRARASASPAENRHPDCRAARAKPSSASLDMSERTCTSVQVFRPGWPERGGARGPRRGVAAPIGRPRPPPRPTKPGAALASPQCALRCRLCAQERVRQDSRPGWPRAVSTPIAVPATCNVTALVEIRRWRRRSGGRRRSGARRSAPWPSG